MAAEDEITIPMICATSATKRPPGRIGRISKDITLPRTVSFLTLGGAISGALVGLLLSLLFAVDLDSIIMFVGISAALGIGAVSYSPLQNESLLKWFELKFKTHTTSRYVNGRRVTVAVGRAVVKAPSSGPVILRRSATRVAAGQYDSRGVLRTVRNRNLDAGTDPTLLQRSASMSEGSRPLPVDGQPVDPLLTHAPTRTAPPLITHNTGFEFEDPLAKPPRRLKD